MKPPTSEQRERWRLQGKCPDCGGDYWAGRGYVGHAPACPKRPKREGEDKALERMGVVIRWPEGPSALSDMVRQPIQRRKRRLY